MSMCDWIIVSFFEFFTEQKGKEGCIFALSDTCILWWWQNTSGASLF